VSRLLVECGEALYGPQWQSALARDLGVADRTVRRWVAGTSEIPVGLYVDLLRVTQERAALLDALAPRLRNAP
jgi:DNA-binding transcriptional regulator YdaS (Cro superfamily)